MIYKAKCANMCSILCCKSYLHIGYLLWHTAMSLTDEKLDALIASVSNLQKSHEQSQLELDEKLQKLEEDSRSHADEHDRTGY